ncbi:cytotoxic and regulatory T-cell molecule [Melopsittacus undulatus]|uniref:cytotoxic and regulatory T-cell molecule n=1 Tax=Melopsittacus undulatus TaxID=13146 RepID=UPI00146B2C10|nr:cytotoxic and regulatory T-cell molecule [Melopsittacus undulatus]
MTLTSLLHITALFLMQGDFPEAGGETITLKEGEDLNLHCTLSSDDGSARQWLNPHGFAIFLNTQRALRDQRYKLIHYSKDELSIQLSNVTVHDEGVYKCFYYGIPFKSKNKTVKVLAAPSNPVLEVSRDTERSVILSCYTQGCKPQARITWLLDNGIELPGDTKHKLEADGKKWTTSSTLTVLAYGPNSTASCIIHHQALREEKLMTSFQFEDLARTVPLGSDQPTITSAIPEDPLVPSSAATPTQQTLQPDVTSTWSEVTPAAAGKEGLAGSSSSHVPSDRDVKSEGMEKKETNLLLPILVAALIFMLLIIVLLFVRKLKKAHGVWKRENDVSDQTLESYKSKSNEDSPGHEKNEHGVNQKSNMQYVTAGYVETMQKNPETKLLQ